ncbi:MAG: phytoene desaturase family protein [Anaerolineae bacterium]
MRRKVVVIGAGFGGLSAAALLARQGNDVTVVEKNRAAGGRASAWSKDGFTFDMGPSWYLMPDVFDRFFAELGTSAERELELSRLSPSYRVYFGPDDVVDVPSDLHEAYALFESFEPGGADKLKGYLDRAEYQYEVAMQQFVYREYKRLTDFFSWRLLLEGAKLNVFTNLDKYVSSTFESDKARKVLEYSMVFLGGAPDNTPALYSIMSHIDHKLGVWYPRGGLNAVAEAIQRLAEAQGAQFVFDAPVNRIRVEDGAATGVETEHGSYDADLVVAAADYHHVETKLLEPRYRQYSSAYWDSRVVAPSAFIMYIGLNRKLPELAHHTLFLQHDWMNHFNTIFKRPAWPERPSYYVCAPSKTDDTVAPDGMENLFVLVPVAAGLDDTPEVRETLSAEILRDLESQIGAPIRDAIVVYREFAHNDFAAEYNAFKGTALGLAHTLRQTAALRPRRKSGKVDDLYFTGQYVHPGVGVPMTLISSQILAEELSS